MSDREVASGEEGHRQPVDVVPSVVVHTDEKPETVDGGHVPESSSLGQTPAPVVVIEDRAVEPVEQIISVETPPVEPGPRRYDDDGTSVIESPGNPDEAGWVFYDASTKSFVTTNGQDDEERGEAS